MESNITLKEICPSTTQKWINEGALLVDVREPNELELTAYNVPNVVNIPLSEFENRFTEIPKGQKVVMACQAGGRSLRATAFLINHGYNPDLVVNMKHGMNRWLEKGFPVKGSVTTVQKGSDDCCSTSGCC